MKRILKIGWVAVLVMLFSAVRNSALAQSGVSVSYQTFYDELSPYGEWIDNPDYGYVWRPEIDDFRPYSTGGHWVWTDDYEWMWASDYDWGWAPFHYGRWVFDDYYGWMWIPGYDWSPGWVQWRTGGDYYGWAPLGPGVDIGLNFSFGNYSAPDYCWNFVPRRYITSSRLYDYCVPYRNNVTIINNTTIINNYRRSNNVFVTGGPGRRDVERYAGRVNPFTLHDASRPGRNVFRRNSVTMYRPQVQRNENNRNIAPRNFERYDRNRANNNGNGNVFQRRNQDGVANNDQRSRPDVLNRTINRGQQQQEQRRQFEQRNADQQRENRNIFERRQQEANQQQQEQRRQFEQRREQQQPRVLDRTINRGQDQHEQRRQFEQRNAEQQRENRNIFERRQQESRQQQQQQQEQRRQFEQRREPQQPRVFDRTINRGQQQQEQRRQPEQRNNNSNDNRGGGGGERRIPGIRHH